MINTNSLAMQAENTRYQRIDFMVKTTIMRSMKKVLEKKKVMAENIRRRLEALGLNQKEFSHQIGISPQHLSFYIHGKREPRTETLNRIAEGLGVDPLELYRIPPGMGDSEFERAWNNLIELRDKPEVLGFLFAFLNLLSDKHLPPRSADILAAIKTLIETIQ